MNISVIIPCYNEARAIIPTLKRIKNTLESIGINHEIIVIDDASTDISKKLIKSFPKKISLIEHDYNQGYGASLKDGIRKAKYEWIVITDADGTYPFEALPRLLRYVPKYDMVIGARTGKHVKIPFVRRPAKWFLKKLSEYLTKRKIPDLNSGLRIFKKDIANRFMSLFPDGFSFTTTITIACLTNKYRVKFIPINYYKRKGKSSISAFRDFSGFIQLILRLTLYFKPLNIFVPFSLLLFFIGFIKIWIDFLIAGSFGLGGAILMLTAIQIGFLGLIADMIIKRTKL
jgi:glycosyltransferase involved in cell wall biosynthesis